MVSGHSQLWSPTVVWCDLLPQSGMVSGRSPARSLTAVCCGLRWETAVNPVRSVAPDPAAWPGRTAISVTVLPLLFYVPEPYPVVVLTPCWFALDQKKASLPRDVRPHRRFLLYDGQITITITGNLSAWFSYGIQCFAHFLQLLRYFYIFLIFWRYI